LRKACFEQRQPQTAKRKPSDDGQPLGLCVKACVHFKCSLAQTLLLTLVDPKSKRMQTLPQSNLNQCFQCCHFYFFLLQMPHFIQHCTDEFKCRQLKNEIPGIRNK